MCQYVVSKNTHAPSGVRSQPCPSTAAGLARSASDLRCRRSSFCLFGDLLLCLPFLSFLCFPPVKARRAAPPHPVSRQRGWGAWGGDERNVAWPRARACVHGDEAGAVHRGSRRFRPARACACRASTTFGGLGFHACECASFRDHAGPRQRAQYSLRREPGCHTPDSDAMRHLFCSRYATSYGRKTLWGLLF